MTIESFTAWEPKNVTHVRSLIMSSCVDGFNYAGDFHSYPAGRYKAPHFVPFHPIGWLAGQNVGAVQRKCSTRLEPVVMIDLASRPGISTVGGFVLTYKYRGVLYRQVLSGLSFRFKVQAG